MSWKERYWKDGVDRQGQLEATYLKWKKEFRNEDCTLLSRVRIEESQNFLLTYLYNNQEYSVQSSSWYHGRRPHQDLNGFSNKILDKYKQALPTENGFILLWVEADSNYGTNIITYSYKGELFQVKSYNLNHKKDLTPHHHRLDSSFEKHITNISKKKGIKRRKLENINKKLLRKEKELGVVVRRYSNYLWKEYLSYLKKFSHVVYLFKDGEEIVYVGSSSKPSERLGLSIGGHKAYSEELSIWISEFTNEADRNIYEIYLMNKYQCPKNIHSKTEEVPTIVLPEISFKQVWGGGSKVNDISGKFICDILNLNLTSFQKKYLISYWEEAIEVSH